MPLPATDAPRTALAQVRVWDLPTRLFHWLLAAACVAGVRRLVSLGD